MNIGDQITVVWASGVANAKRIGLEPATVSIADPDGQLRISLDRDPAMTDWISRSEEGIIWIRGKHDENSTAGRALLAANALS